MKDKIIALLLILAATVSCTKSDHWPSAEENLYNAANRLFDKSVGDAVSTIRFCALFQEYLDAPDKDKLLAKFTKVRETVTMIGQDTYKTRYGVMFTTNGIPFGQAGATVMFDEKVEAHCTDENEWEVIANQSGSDLDNETISYTVAYKILPDSGKDSVAEITVQGVLKADEYSETAGYSATFGTDAPLRLSGNSYTGTFRMTTHDSSGSQLDEYTLLLGKPKQ